MKTSQKPTAFGRRHQNRHYAIRLMAAIAVSAFGAIAIHSAYAQSTSSSIFGRAPADSTITVHSDNGGARHGTANSKGRYTLTSLLPGTYVVSLERNGQTVAKVQGVPLFASRSSQVDFVCDNDQCTGTFGR
ncbi:carboxypeptidase-like regulatory domain-containing protein [Dyella choica]|nr:carboxypeptidase-like regulatory domain-containing protein [Dyella choica]